MSEKASLRELVDLNELQAIQDGFAKTVDISSVIFSPEGEPLTQFSNPTRFCSLIQSTKEGKRRCSQSFMAMSQIALTRKEPKIYYCFAHGGHFVAQIISDGEHKGTMFAGQFIPQTFSAEQLKAFEKIAVEINVDPTLLVEEAKKMRVVEEDRVWNYSSLLFQIVGLITKLGAQADVLNRAKDALQKAHNGLEIRVQERTAELKRANAELKQEIIERKKAEEALWESEGRFRALTESTSDWIWEVDENAVYTYVSPKIKELLGYEPEEIIGKTPFDLMTPEDVKRVAAEFGAIAEAQKPFDRLENENLHKDGQKLVLETSGVPIFGANGNFRGYRGIDRDITERKRAENEFLKKNEELELFNRLAVGRELKMIERKKEINALLEVLGKEPRYKIAGK